MNKKAQKAVLGFAFIAMAFVFILTLFALLEPFKEFLDTARDSTSLNCIGTTNFNQTDYDDDSTLEQLTKRPTCFVTGLSLVYFFGSFLIAVAVWVFSKWMKAK